MVVDLDAHVVQDVLMRKVETEREGALIQKIGEIEEGHTQAVKEGDHTLGVLERGHIQGIPESGHIQGVLKKGKEVRAKKEVIVKKEVAIKSLEAEVPNVLNRKADANFQGHLLKI